MAVMSLVPKTKMAHVGKLISVVNLLVRKVTWLVLITTSATFILSRDFGADCVTRIAYIYILSSSKNSFFSISTHRDNTHCNLQRQLTLSILTHRDNTHTLSLLHLTSSSQSHENVYILQPFSFLFYLFGLTFSSLKHNHRNIVKP